MSAFGNDAVPAVGGVSADTIAQLVSQFAIDVTASAGRVVAISAGNTTDGLGAVVVVAGASFTIPASTSRYICLTPLNVLVMEAAITVGNLALWQFSANADTIVTAVDLRYNFSGVPTVAAFLTVGGMDYFTVPIGTSAANAAASAAAALISENAAAASAASAAADAISTAADAVSTAADVISAAGSEVNAANSAAAALGSKNVAVASAATATTQAALATTKASEASASAAAALLSKNTATTMASAATTMATSAQASSISASASKVAAAASELAAQASATSADASATVAMEIAAGDFVAALQTAALKASPDDADKLMMLDSSTGYSLKAVTYATLLNAVTLTGDTVLTGNVIAYGRATLGGTAAQTNSGLYVLNDDMLGAYQYGLNLNVRAGSEAVTEFTGISVYGGTLPAAFTCAAVYGMQLLNAAKGAGSTITNLAALRIANQTAGTNNYGLISEVSAAANKWNIYVSGTANNAFAGNVRIGSTVAPTVALDVTGAISATNTQAASSSFTFTNASAAAGAYTQVVAAGDAGSCIMGYSGSGNAVTGAFYDGDFAYLLGSGATAGLNIGAGVGAISLYAGGTGAGNKIATVSSTGVAVTGAISATATAATAATSFVSTGSTTAFNRGRIYNTGGDIRFGVEASISSQALAGSTAYASFIGSFTNTPLHLVSNSAIVATASGTGLAVVEGFGCNGKTAQTEVTVNAASTDLATVIALCNQLRAALIANGICV